MVSKYVCQHPALGRMTKLTTRKPRALASRARRWKSSILTIVIARRESLRVSPSLTMEGQWPTLVRSYLHACRTTRADLRMAPPAKPLPAGEGKWDINLPEDDGTKSTKGRMFTVIIKSTRTIDIGGFTSRLARPPHLALLSSAQHAESQVHTSVGRLAVFVRGEGAGGGNFPDASEVQSATQARESLRGRFGYPSRAR